MASRALTECCRMAEGGLAAGDRSSVELKFVDGSAAEIPSSCCHDLLRRGSDGKGDHFFYRFVHGADSPRDIQVLLWRPEWSMPLWGAMHCR